MRTTWSGALLGVITCAAAATHAQAPPIHGVTGTIATPTTIKEEHEAAEKAATKTKEAAERLYRAAKGLFGGDAADPLADLRPGTTVVISYRAAEPAATSDPETPPEIITTEGTVVQVDRGKNEIAVRLSNRTIENLILANRVAVDRRDTPAPPIRMVEYYSDEAGGRVTRRFTVRQPE